MSQDSVTSVYSEIPVQKSVQYSQLFGGGAGFGIFFSEVGKIHSIRF